MTAYQIQVSEPAEAEVDAVYQHFFLRSPAAADHFRDDFASAAQSLEQMPQRCALAPENGWLDREVRQLVFRRGKSAYRILFSIFEPAEDEPAFVRILRVRHGVQQRLGQANQNENAESA